MADVTARLANTGTPAAQLATWSQLQGSWQTLEKAVAARSLPAGQSIAQHTQLIASAMQLGESLLSLHGLQTDPQSDTHALIQASLVHAPMLAEKMGVMRAQGAGFLAAGELPPQGKGVMPDGTSHFSYSLIPEKRSQSNQIIKTRTMPCFYML